MVSNMNNNDYELREHPDFPDYKISNYGDVFNIKTSKYLKGSGENERYKRYKIINKEGVKKFVLTHRLVYELFVGKLIDGMMIDHIDRNKLNNYYKNLRQLTASENAINKITRSPFIAYDTICDTFYICDNYTLFMREISNLKNDSYSDAIVKKSLNGTYKDFKIIENTDENFFNKDNRISYLIELNEDILIERANNILNTFSETIESK